MGALTIQPTDADNVMWSGSANSNYGSLTGIDIGANSGIYRSLLKFDFGALPGNAILDSVSLSVYIYGIVGSSGRTLWAYRLTQTGWTELGSTWNKYDGSNSWSSAGGDYTTTNGVSISGPGAGNWATWDVLTLANYARINTGKILYILLKDGTETDGQLSQIYSNNYTTDATKCPKLILNYHLIAPFVLFKRRML
jgi:hypothetical protein